MLRYALRDSGVGTGRVHYHEKLRISCKLLRGRLAHGDKPLRQALPFDQRLL